MPNLVFKFIQPNPMDLDATQRWLEELAAEGLHLVHWWPYFCVFQQGEPKRVRYRLDPGRAEPGEFGIPDDMRETYKEMGWDYVSTANPGKFRIFVSGDPAAPELYTDLDSLSLAMKGVAKEASRAFRGTISIFVLGLFLLRQYFSILGSTPVQTAISVVHPLHFFWLLFMVLIVVPTDYLFYRRLRRTLRRLKNGAPIPRSNAGYRARSIIHYLNLFLLAASLLIQSTMDKPDPLRVSLEELNFPVPSLVELEDRPDFALVPFSDTFESHTASEYGSHAYRRAFALAPIRYEIQQLGESGQTLDITLWEVRYPELAPKLMGELLTAPYAGSLASLNVEGIDQAVLCQNSSTPGQILLLHRGNRVAKLSYQGEASLETQLDTCAAMMAADWSFS